jgi:hypothetical protein
LFLSALFTFRSTDFNITLKERAKEPIILVVQLTLPVCYLIVLSICCNDNDFPLEFWHDTSSSRKANKTTPGGNRS